MVQYFEDYVWKNGLPYGIRLCNSEILKKGIHYKIVSDPYHKRVSIEKYSDDIFSCVLYDSALFDFRHLKQGEQLAWQKTVVSETEDTSICHIRNQDDRLILIEEYLFEKDYCRECRTFSPLGVLLSVQKIYYKFLNDPVNGVSLYDSNGNSVMLKHYEFDEISKEFTELLKEDWALTKMNI